MSGDENCSDVNSHFAVSFAASRIGVFGGHIRFLFGLLIAAAPAADEIWVQKKRAVSDARIAKMV